MPAYDYGQRSEEGDEANLGDRGAGSYGLVLQNSKEERRKGVASYQDSAEGRRDKYLDNWAWQGARRFVPSR